MEAASAAASGSPYTVVFVGFHWKVELVILLMFAGTVYELVETDVLVD